MRRAKMGFTIISLALGLIASLAMDAQTADPSYRVGVLTPHMRHKEFPVFLDALRQLGYQEKQNLHLLVRSAEGQLERLPALATELVEAQVDVIVSFYTPGTRAAINATKTIPIVMAIVGAPVATGFVTSLSRPGGNVTGISNMSSDLSTKRLELLKEIVPEAKRIAVMLNPNDPVTSPQIQDAKRAAPALGIEIRFFPVRHQGELPPAFDQLVKWKANAIMWLAGQSIPFQKATRELAAQHRLPAMVLQKDDVESGGLISYFPDHSELFRRIAVYVDRILRGIKPGDLPVERPSRFELAVNLRTARALGLTIPASILVLADRVIQ